MALKGNLKDFSITQILNLINLAKKSGALYIEGSGDIAQVFFREGKLTYVQIGQQEKNLLQLFLEAKKISSSQYNLLEGRTKNLNDKEVGLFLVNSGYVSQSETFEVLGDHLSEIMRTLFTWLDGYFHFEQNEFPPEERIPSRLGLENLIVEGARKIQELEDLRAEIPSLEMALKFADRPGIDIHNVNLSPEEWRVISFVNPKNTIQQIATATKLDDLEIRKVVYALLQAGLVEIIRPSGSPVALNGKVIKPMDHKEQKSLVNRLIARIRSI
ncbi:MAG: DUF4388 domain-containing protein [Anaerolineaceae bacterium]